MRLSLSYSAILAIACLAFAPSTSWAGAPSFFAGVNFVVHSPVSVAIADFNGDGKADVAAADYHRDRVVVLFAGGKRVFVPVGTDPISIVTADFNGDGRPDFATANRSSNNVSVVLGSGGGTFATAVAIGVGAEPRDIVTGKFNGDDRPDLAVVSRAAMQVAVMFGSGGGAFSPPVAYPAGQEPLALAHGDVNNDGRQDLVAMSKYSISILLGTNGGTFQQGAFYPAYNLTDIRLGDLDGDGSLDLVTANALNGARAFVLIGNGDGTFQSATAYPLPYAAAAIVIHDFNGDGNADVATGGLDLNGLSISLGNGDGTLQPPRSVPSGSVQSIAVFDFDSNGTQDVALADPNGAVVAIRMGRGDGTFQTEPLIRLAPNSGPVSILAADLNEDGHSDLVAGFVEGPALAVSLGNGDGSFQPAQYFSAPRLMDELTAADFNSDGNQDIAGLFYSESGDTLVIMSGNGDGTLQPPVETFFAGGPATLTTSDFNLDGNQDIAVGLENDSEVVLLLGNGDGTFQSISFAAVALIEVLTAADFNADGIPDLAMGHLSPVVTVLLGNGDGTFVSAGHFSTNTGWRNPSDLTTADVNKDGAVDMAVGAADSEVGVLLGNGDGTLVDGQHFPPGGLHPIRVEAADVNGDSHTDLIALDAGSNAVSVLLGNSTGAFTAEWGCPATHDCAVVNFSVGAYPRDMAVADFNHDLKPDVATANQISNSISILINTSP